MQIEQITVPEVSLPPTMPVQLPPPLFQLDQTLKFCKVPTGDFGRVVGYVFAAAASVQAIGFHYLLVLDPESPSRKELGILSDWIFEGDASPVATDTPVCLAISAAGLGPTKPL